MAEPPAAPGKAGTDPDLPAEVGRPGPRPVSERHWVRAFFGRNRGLNVTYRVVIAVVGAAIMATGFTLVPLPGPGWLIVFAGLAVLASEFDWAERLLHFGRGKLRAWTHWVTRQSVLVRFAIGLAGLALIAAVLWTLLAWQGVPAWLPDWLLAWVPIG